jgi:DNA-binding PadR family transcriptional regulator
MKRAEQLLPYFTSSSDNTLIQLMDRIEEATAEQISSSLLVSCLEDLVDRGLVTVESQQSCLGSRCTDKPNVRGKLRITPAGIELRAALRAKPHPHAAILHGSALNS